MAKAFVERFEVVVAIVHAEIDGEHRRLVRQNIAFESAVTARGAIAADANVTKDEVVGRKTRLAPGFDIGAVESLLGDAVAHHDDDIAFLQEEVLRRSDRRNDREEYDCQEPVHERSFREFVRGKLNSIGCVIPYARRNNV